MISTRGPGSPRPDEGPGSPRPNMVRLPNLIIAGVAKAGTTSLFRYLSQHPDVCPSKKKELGYFSTIRYGEGPWSLEEYAAHFSHCGTARYVMEATPGYFFGGAPVIEALERVLDRPRVVVVLRDPVTKFWSYYNFQRSRFQIDRDLAFGEYLATCERLRAQGVDHLRENNAYWALSSGFYADCIDDWFDALGERFKVVFFEHMVSQPQATVADLLVWMQVDASVARDLDYSPENRTMQYRSATLRRAVSHLPGKNSAWLMRHPRIRSRLQRLYQAVNRDKTRETALTAHARERLEEIYRPANVRLAEQLRRRGVRDLPGWLRAAESQRS